MDNLAFIGKLLKADPIEGADRIVKATVVCGGGGKWTTVMRKTDLDITETFIVFLPDSIVPRIPELEFLAPSYRVKQQRFKGVPSEVVAIPNKVFPDMIVGEDVTLLMGVHKYDKPTPDGGRAKGDRPSFIPKTDEPLFQGVPHLVQELARGGLEWYTAIKYDGSSMTVFNHEGEIGVTSRNIWKQEADGCKFWSTAKKYRLHETMPPDYALQMELVGPKIQGNPLKLAAYEVRVFDLYHIPTRRYQPLSKLQEMCDKLDVPIVEHRVWGNMTFEFNAEDGSIYELAKVKYHESGAEAEGIVVRTTNPTYIMNHKGFLDRLSFKVVNLDYKDKS
jgi:RNA ligase (TIGR02306 family)